VLRDMHRLRGGGGVRGQDAEENLKDVFDQ